jgi:signal transduction histidine kinase
MQFALGPEALMRRLTAALAHNVNNALTGVIGYLELALDPPDASVDPDACIRSGLACAYRAADAVRRIVGCARSIAEAEPPAPQSLLRLAESAAQRLAREAPPLTATVAGASSAQVFVSAGLVSLALDGLLRAVASPAGGAIRLRVADEEGRCVLYAEGGAAGPDLQLRLLEPALMIELQGGALEVLSAAGKTTSLKLWLPSRGEAPVRRDDAQSAPPAPHLPAALGLFRQAV